jgi:type 1 fimbria pilin
MELKVIVSLDITKVVIGEVRYPSNMFTKYTDAEKAAIGIYPVEDSGTKGDDRFEYTSQATYTWSASDKKVTTSYTITEKSLVDVEAKDGDGNNILDKKGNKTYSYGLKTQAKNLAKQQANNYIARFNWLVERSIYDNTDGSVKTIAPIHNWSDDYDVQQYVR